ncbi:hypothetical protein Q5424_11835 [Conexibacter sp. JD483]|uniref:hypothetical protein n=1 Tax=unclassified Conexibacter TaxID=2627773 RepID=UPI0027211A49|nr:MULTISPECIES: hypothetical protein [unclassified Conexibacter]MDO8187858.1 hypothetical protein [Conexibacter sp. CPCC 205706]MDO8201210.1 hypothetical protein [Conexibacter sp. CPCC 205762]MDR9369778.1 hypothetical protein [Conexibacter sp. JD483]
MNKDSMTGMVGTVTGTVRPGTLGEVMIAIRGGVEAFYALPFDGEEVIPAGARCAVVDYRPQEASRTVYVTALPDVP